MWYTHTKTHAEWLWCFTVNGEWRSSEWRTHTSMVRMSSIRKSIQKRCGPFSKLYTTHYIGTLISLSVYLSLCVCTFFVVVYRRHRIRQKRAKNQCSDIISLVVCTNRCNFQVTALVKFGSMRFVYVPHLLWAAVPFIADLIKWYTLRTQKPIPSYVIAMLILCNGKSYRSTPPRSPHSNTAIQYFCKNVICSSPYGHFWTAKASASSFWDRVKAKAFQIDTEYYTQ